IADEGRALGGSLLRRLEAALPLEHRPTLVVVLHELREDLLPVHLSVSRGAEATSAIFPVLIPAVHAGPSIRAEFGVLHVKGLDTLVIQLEVLDVVELLQHEVAGIEEQAG